MFYQLQFAILFYRYNIQHTYIHTYSINTYVRSLKSTQYNEFHRYSCDRNVYFVENLAPINSQSNVKISLPSRFFFLPAFKGQKDIGGGYRSSDNRGGGLYFAPIPLATCRRRQLARPIQYDMNPGTACTYMSSSEVTLK